MANSNSTSRPSAERFQLNAFYVLLGWGTLMHELCWYGTYVSGDHATLGTYLGAYQLLIPTVMVPGWVAAASHAAYIIFAILMIVDRRKTLWALVEWPLVCWVYWLLGTKPPNHYAVLILLYSIHAAWWLSVCLHRGQVVADGGVPRLRFLRLNVLLLMGGVYVVACLAKLNWTFLDPAETVVQGFVWQAVAPFNHLLNEVVGEDHALVSAAKYGYGVLGIVMTLFFELGIPLCLLRASTRRVAVVLGLFFHSLIMFQSALDFSMISLATYPMFLSARELVDFVNNYARRPGRFAVLATAVVGAYLGFLTLWFESHDPLYLACCAVSLCGALYLGFSTIDFCLGRVRATPRLLYDGQCVFCRRSVDWLRPFDWVGMDYDDFHTFPVVAARSLDMAALNRRMHLVLNYEVYQGFYAFRVFAVYSGGPLTLLSPFLYLPGAGWIGQPVYDLIAHNRYRILGMNCESGACQLPGTAGARKSEQEDAAVSRR